MDQGSVPDMDQGSVPDMDQGSVQAIGQGPDRDRGHTGRTPGLGAPGAVPACRRPRTGIRGTPDTRTAIPITGGTIMAGIRHRQAFLSFRDGVDPLGTGRQPARAWGHSGWVWLDY